MKKPLWEEEHPYYATEGNYHANGWHTEYETWQQFVDAEGDADPDLNFVYRWDWREGEDWGHQDFNGDTRHRSGALMLYFVLQRKAATRSVEVSVCRDDEPEVRRWLEGRWRRMQAVWGGFSGVNCEDIP